MDSVEAVAKPMIDVEAVAEAAPVLMAARRTQRTPKAAGLTEQELDRLLADES